jgi:hypothetical protein
MTHDQRDKGARRKVKKVRRKPQTECERARRQKIMFQGEQGEGSEDILPENQQPLKSAVPGTQLREESDHRTGEVVSRLVVDLGGRDRL